RPPALSACIPARPDAPSYQTNRALLRRDGRHSELAVKFARTLRSTHLINEAIYAALKTVPMPITFSTARHDQGIRQCHYGADHSRSFAYWQARRQLLRKVPTILSDRSRSRRTVRGRCMR